MKDSVLPQQGSHSRKKEAVKRLSSAREGVVMAGNLQDEEEQIEEVNTLPFAKQYP